MSMVSALYLILLAGVAGYVLVARVPSLLHTPLLSGSNFIHGIVLAGAMLALSNATGTLETALGFLAVMAASANVVGGFVVTDRMLSLFNRSGTQAPESLSNSVAEPAADSIVERRAGKRPISSDTGRPAASDSSHGEA